MDHAEFLSGMNRIMERFGKKPYTPEVNSQIWDAWQDLPVNPWDRLVNDFLLRKKTPPMPFEFITMARAENHRRLRIVTEQTSGPEYESIFSDQERTEMLSFVKQAATGKVPRKHIMQFAKSVQNIIDLKSRIKCAKCRDGALMAYKNSEGETIPFVFRCNCNKGLSRQESWPQWSETLRSRYTPESEVFKKELDESMHPDGPSAS